MTEHFAADIRHNIDSWRLELVRFGEGQGNAQVAKQCLAGHDGWECILFARLIPYRAVTEWPIKPIIAITGDLMRCKGRFVVTVVAGALGLLALSTGGARADTISSLQLTSFYQIVADTPQDHLFLSSPGQDSIFVTNLTGGPVDQISNLGGVEGIALSADGNTLYAALSSADAVDAISTSSFDVTATYPLPAGDSPWNVAVQSDAVWVGYQTGSPGSSGIGDVDLSASAPAFTAQPGMGTWHSAPQLAADPADGGVLVALEPGLSSTQAATFSTSSSPAAFTETASTDPTSGLGGVDGCENETDLAVIPGGTQFLVACGALSTVDGYTMTDLSAPAVSYSGPAAGSGAHSTAAAVAPNGTVTAGFEGAVAPDLFTYQSGQSTPAASYAVSGSGMTIAARGVAWSADSSQLFTVIAISVNGSTVYSLRVLYPPLASSVLSLNTDSAAYGAPVNVTGGLFIGPNGTMQPGANDTVTITRTPADSNTPTATYTVTTDANGDFTQPDTASPPLPLGSYTYTASYAGDSATAPATAAQVVTVVPDKSNLTLTGTSTAVVGKSVSVTGTLALSVGSPAIGTQISITRTLAGSTATAHFTVKTTTSGGGFALTDAPQARGTYTYTASYAGDSVTSPSTATHQVTITGLSAALSVTTGATTFNYDATITVTAHLGSTATDRTVSIYAQPLGQSKRTLLKTGRVNSAGILTVSYVAPHSTEFSEVFAGDARYTPRTVTHTVSVRARVTQTISGYYTSKTVGGTVYRVYHHTALLHVAVAVAPNKHGQCVEIQVQQFYNNRWNSNLTTGCGNLSSSSTVSGNFNLTQATGGTFRLRADYVRSATDISNISTSSSWAYFTVVT